MSLERWGVTPQTPPFARIFQLNASPGGVPKRAITHANLTDTGLDVDKVNNTRVHGGPNRALCLYPLERILALQEEGASIFPGAIGENVTTVGLEWDLVVPGAKIALGEALIEITKYAEPCSTTSPFVCGDLKRYHQAHHPGWSRVYARVLRKAPLAPGLPVRLV